MLFVLYCSPSTATHCRRCHCNRSYLRQKLAKAAITGISLKTRDPKSHQKLVRVAAVVAIVINWMTTRSMDLSPTTRPNPSPAIMSPATGSMASSAATMPNPSIYTNYVNVHLSIDKLDGTNYDTWALDIKLWLKN